MIWILWALACTCASERPKPPAATPSVDRTSVQGATCYRGEDGTVLELLLSARTDVNGTLTRPGSDARPLEGRRHGRILDFGVVQVELLGRSVALTDGPDKSMLQASGCP